jgi:hypothetical protein
LFTRGKICANTLTSHITVSPLNNKKIVKIQNTLFDSIVQRTPRKGGYGRQSPEREGKTSTADPRHEQTVRSGLAFSTTTTTTTTTTTSTTKLFESTTSGCPTS